MADSPHTTIDNGDDTLVSVRVIREMLETFKSLGTSPEKRAQFDSVCQEYSAARKAMLDFRGPEKTMDSLIDSFNHALWSVIRTPAGSKAQLIDKFEIAEEMFEEERTDGEHIDGRAVAMFKSLRDDALDII